jgi:hypothetical protein
MWREPQALDLGSKSALHCGEQPPLDYLGCSERIARPAIDTGHEHREMRQVDEAPWPIGVEQLTGPDFADTGQRHGVSSNSSRSPLSVAFEPVDSFLWSSEEDRGKS